MSQLPAPASAKRAVLLVALMVMSTHAFAADPIEEKAKFCTACHGESGVPQLKTTPVIWGQNAGYLFLQLRDFQSGARKNDLMSPVAATLARENLLPLATYFSKLKWPNLATAVGAARRRHQRAKGKRVHRLHGLPSRPFSGRRLHGPPRRPATRLSVKDNDGFSRPHTRQQSRHVRSHECGFARRSRRARAISRRPADRPISQPGPVTCSGWNGRLA